MTYQSRQDIPQQYKWDMTAIFDNEAQWESQLTRVLNELNTVGQFKGTLTESAQRLYEAFEMYHKLSKQLSIIYIYAHLQHDTNTTDSHYAQLLGKARHALNQFNSLWSFFTPELLAADEQRINQFVAEYEPLAEYRFELEKLNLQRPHTLSLQEEKLLAMAQNALSSSADIFKQLDNADLTFKDVQNTEGKYLPLTHGSYSAYLQSEDRQLRKNTFKTLYKQYHQHQNTLAATLTSHLKAQLFNAKARHYESTRARALSNNYIPETVYDNLINTVNAHLPVLHRYTELRKRLLKLDELHMYDVYAPLMEDTNFTVTFDEAIDICKKALAPLGQEYVDLVQRSVDERWIDVYETKGKRSGGYSSGSQGTYPYILLNWQNNWSSMYTLIHELGHSIHSYYTFNHQPYQYANYSIFVAEVASTCNEALLSEYLFNLYEGDKQKQLAVLNTQLDRMVSTLFRQTMFAEFEHHMNKEISAKDILTAAQLNEDYYHLVKKYQGPALTVDEEIQYEWARIPHFYYNYYVYQYATGVSAAEALSAKILKEGQKAAQCYIDKFLKAGNSNYPIEVLKAVGVNMEEKTPIEQAIQKMSQTLDRYEALLD